MPPKSYWLLSFLLMSVFLDPVTAQRKSKVIKGFTESQLINRIDACISNEDPYCYLSLFPDLDTLTGMVMAITKPNSKDYQEMAALQRDPVRMMHADSLFHSRLKETFEAMIAQGKAQGIHWSSIVPVRYELLKSVQTRNELYERLAPSRFTGYVFIMDPLTHKTYGYTVMEMLQIQNEWYGGYLGEVFEANTTDEYEDMRIAARRERSKPKDTTAVAKADPENGEKDDDEEEAEVQKMIVDRKFYTGMFDNEIPVQLYVRSLKGTCKEAICFWEAIYKFGDQDEYILLKVHKTEDGKWTFTEEPPTGSMDLTLKDGVYTGTWTSTDGQTGYEVKLTEAPASPKKRDNLEAAFLSIRQGEKK